MNPSDQNLKLCSLCAEEIPKEAIKCRRCNGYQQPWFFLNLGVPTLGLLVALVSVVSLSLPIVAKLFSDDNSDVRVEFQNFEDGAAYFVASNLGTRPGTVTEVYLDYGTQPNPVRYNLKGDPTLQFIEPGASRQLTFEIPCYDDQKPRIHYRKSGKFGSRPIATDVRINVVIVQFDGDQSTIITEIDELSGIMAINDKHSECLSAKLRGVEAQDSRSSSE